MVGKDITERLFLPRFCEMCCDCRMFHVRKVRVLIGPCAPEASPHWSPHASAKLLCIVVIDAIFMLYNKRMVPLPMAAIFFAFLAGLCSQFRGHLQCGWWGGNRGPAGMLTRAETVLMLDGGSCAVDVVL